MKNTPINYGKNGTIAIAGENIRRPERFEAYARKMKAMEIKNRKKAASIEREEALLNK